MFNLRRYFAVASLIGIATVIVALSLVLRSVANQALLNHQALANEAITNSFANSVWPEFSEFVKSSYQPDFRLTIAEQAELPRLQKLTAEQMSRTNVVKVKIFNLDGLTVFSTDPGQIGQDKSNGEGFIKAKSGVVHSEMSFRDEFYAIEEMIVDRNLVSSYVPIEDADNGAIIAVFEVYSDVTPTMSMVAIAQRNVIAVVLVTSTMLYIFLFFIVNRANRFIKQQEAVRKTNEDKIRYQAYNDALTGLPNRNLFLERMEEALDRAQRQHKTGALMFLDLDRFKLVNDSLGHDAGDQLLRVTASRLQHSLRDTDMAFRMSGDEFTVLMEDLSATEDAATQDAATQANKILAAMKDPIHLQDHEIYINTSVGITLFPKPGVDMDGLVKEADSAMYSAKQNTRNSFEFFSPEMNRVAAERLTMETDLQRAIKENQFVLYYQPKVHAQTREIISVEALLRWQHPTQGLLPPDDFVSVLEDIGLINQVGEWVLLTACSQMRSWIEAGMPPLRMSVNVSAHQFRSNELVDTVRQILTITELEPKFLELELTESMFVENTDYAIRIMSDLKELGVVLSIDDFGSGYSSLSSLKNFPVDYLKIDQSFIKDMENNSSGMSITGAITALAQSLNLRLIAEGVEDESQVALLQQNGCHELQGFLFSVPIPADRFENEFLIRYQKTG